MQVSHKNKNKKKHTNAFPIHAISSRHAVRASAVLVFRGGVHHCAECVHHHAHPRGRCAAVGMGFRATAQLHWNIRVLGLGVLRGRCAFLLFFR